MGPVAGVRLIEVPVKTELIVLKCPSKATVYAPASATNLQIRIVICCFHLLIHHISRITFLILGFLDFVDFVVRTLIFP